MNEQRVRELFSMYLQVYEETAEYLKRYHECLGQNTNHDLLEADCWNGIWILSGHLISLHKGVLVLLQNDVFHQSLPLVRSIHETNQLLYGFIDNKNNVETWMQHPLKQSTLRTQQKKSIKLLKKEAEKDGYEIDVLQNQTAEVYKFLSNYAHSERSHLLEEVIVNSRSMVYDADQNIVRQVSYLHSTFLIFQESVLLIGYCFIHMHGIPDNFASPAQATQEVIDAFERCIEAL